MTAREICERGHKAVKAMLDGVVTPQETTEILNGLMDEFERTGGITPEPEIAPPDPDDDDLEDGETPGEWLPPQDPALDPERISEYA